MNDRLNGSQHNDVLRVEPADDEERSKLVEEMKRRANAAYKIGSLREALKLYSRCIEICRENYVNQTLFSNRSMTNSKMGFFEDAKADALSFLKLSPSSSKAKYRLAVALRGLSDFEGSISKFTEALAIEPNNKALIKELNLTKKLQENHEINKRKKEKEEFELQNIKNVTVSKKIYEIGKLPDVKQSDQSKVTVKEEDMSLRGYRKTKDGKVTTFFNTERTEEELKLIGENKPQKLTDNNIKKTSEIPKGVSAWNEKGTFEEKDFTAWAKQRLIELLSDIRHNKEFVMKENKYTLIFDITDFKEFEGHASKTFTRKKFRHIFDFSFRLPITIKCLDSKRKVLKKVSLELFFPDFSGDVMTNEDDIECQLNWSNRNNAGIFETCILAEVSNNLSNFRKSIIQSFSQFCTEFYMF